MSLEAMAKYFLLTFPQDAMMVSPGDGDEDTDVQSELIFVTNPQYVEMEVLTFFPTVMRNPQVSL